MADSVPKTECTPDSSETTHADRSISPAESPDEAGSHGPVENTVEEASPPPDSVDTQSLNAHPPDRPAASAAAHMLPEDHTVGIAAVHDHEGTLADGGMPSDGAVPPTAP